MGTNSTPVISHMNKNNRAIEATCGFYVNILKWCLNTVAWF